MVTDKPTIDDVFWNEESGEWEFRISGSLPEVTKKPVRKPIENPVRNETDFPVENENPVKNSRDFPVRFVKRLAVYAFLVLMTGLFAYVLGVTLEGTYESFGVLGLAVAWVCGSVLATLAAFNKDK